MPTAIVLPMSVGPLPAAQLLLTAPLITRELPAMPNPLPRNVTTPNGGHCAVSNLRPPSGARSVPGNHSYSQVVYPLPATDRPDRYIEDFRPYLPDRDRS
jgi:hypothetical protein